MLLPINFKVLIDVSKISLLNHAWHQSQISAYLSELVVLHPLLPLRIVAVLAILSKQFPNTLVMLGFLLGEDMVTSLLKVLL